MSENGAKPENDRQPATLSSTTGTKADEPAANALSEPVNEVPAEPTARPEAKTMAEVTEQATDQATAEVGSEARAPDPSALWSGHAPGPVDTGEFFLGSEAAVPPRDFGPPVESHFPDVRSPTREMSELERRLQARMSPAYPIEERRELPFEGLWKRLRRVAMRGRSDMVDDFGRDPLYSARYQPILDFLYRAYFRVQVEGIEQVPAIGPVILVANHSGMLPYDGLLAMHALRHEHPARRESRPLIEDYVFHFPYLGMLVNRIGGVRACPENAERLLARGEVIIVFPEGVKGIGKLYKDRYQLQRFGRGGVVRLALRTGTPIVPLAIVGAEETNPMLGRVTWLSKVTGIPFLPLSPTGLAPLPVKWSMRFGPAIDLTREHGPEAAGDRLLVNRITDQVRETIQGMLDHALSHRVSLFRG